MIQRIQTVFLILAVCTIGLEVFTPIVRSSITETSGVYQDGLLFIKEDILSMSILIIAAVLALITILLFKNRRIQKWLILLSIAGVFICNLLFGWLYLPITQHIMKNTQATIQPGLGAFMPIVTVLALIFAYKGVKKDDIKIRSMDRLR